MLVYSTAWVKLVFDSVVFYINVSNLTPTTALLWTNKIVEDVIIQIVNSSSNGT